MCIRDSHLGAPDVLELVGLDGLVLEVEDLDFGRLAGAGDIALHHLLQKFGDQVTAALLLAGFIAKTAFGNDLIEQARRFLFDCGGSSRRGGGFRVAHLLRVSWFVGF